MGDTHGFGIGNCHVDEFVVNDYYVGSDSS